MHIGHGRQSRKSRAQAAAFILGTGIAKRCHLLGPLPLQDQVQAIEIERREALRKLAGEDGVAATPVQRQGIGVIGLKEQHEVELASQPHRLTNLYVVVAGGPGGWKLVAENLEKLGRSPCFARSQGVRETVQGKPWPCQRVLQRGAGRAQPVGGGVRPVRPRQHGQCVGEDTQHVGALRVIAVRRSGPDQNGVRARQPVQGQIEGRVHDREGRRCLGCGVALESRDTILSDLAGPVSRPVVGR